MLVLLERGCYTVGMIDAAGESKLGSCFGFFLEKQFMSS